jgi:MYXO-CTERM domain-containing protein
MSMKSVLAVLVCGAFVGAVPSLSQAALARKKVGGTAPLASYSATLSSNSVIRQQQLICDPPEPLRGSTSVEYEPDKVTLSGFDFGPGYGPSILQSEEFADGFVEVVSNNEVFLQPINAFLQRPDGRETGYVQVYYSLNREQQAGQIAPFGPILDEDPGLGDPGEGVDTHQLLFNVLDTPGLGPATYHVYGDRGGRGIDPDFLEGLDDAGNSFIVPFDQIHDATVTAPEPSALALAGLASLGLLRRRRLNSVLEPKRI